MAKVIIAQQIFTKHNTASKRSISPKAHEKIRNVFNEVDVNNDHSIDWSEIELCCEKLQMKLNDKDKESFYQCDTDNNGSLDINEFIEFVHIRLRRVFDEIDTDKSGELDEYEISEVLHKLGIKMSQRQIHSIIQDMDNDGNGKIDFKEFSEFFSDVPTLDLKTMADKWLYGEGLDIGGDNIPSLPPAEIPLLQFMAAGAAGGVVSRTACAPLEKIKILAQTSAVNEKVRVKSTFLDIFRHQGVRGLFAGNLVNCLRIIPTGATVSLVYSRMLKYTPVDNVKNPNQPLWRLLSGATAGTIATVVTHPLDVVRARLTIQDTSSKSRENYSGILNTFKKIKLNEGFRGYFKGLTPAVQSVAPFMAVQQCLYDVSKNAFTETEYGKHPITFLGCGALSGVAAQTVVHPLDVVRRLKQVETTTDSHTKLKKTSSAVLSQLRREGGVRRLYAGITAGYLKVMPSVALTLIVRDAVLGRLTSEDP